MARNHNPMHGHFSGPHASTVPQSRGEPAGGSSEADVQCKSNIDPIDNKTTPNLYVGTYDPSYAVPYTCSDVEIESQGRMPKNGIQTGHRGENRSSRKTSFEPRLHRCREFEVVEVEVRDVDHDATETKCHVPHEDVG
ncbi:unnamed protein product [Clonostachys byssicola]|uniref:Uncharacterized protein n=1 Tax=Clonostachys byssicola TaxID=160290 RepID=A0A9N9Y040_9HYPO|nr:unnamed protein product [Clonostachys byssicola]